MIRRYVAVEIGRIFENARLKNGLDHRIHFVMQSIQFIIIIVIYQVSHIRYRRLQ